MLTLSNDIRCCLQFNVRPCSRGDRSPCVRSGEERFIDRHRGKVVVALYYDGAGVFGEYFVFIRDSDHGFYGRSLDGRISNVPSGNSRMSLSRSIFVRLCNLTIHKIPVSFPVLQSSYKQAIIISKKKKRKKNETR
jgi:hypothetical protein